MCCPPEKRVKINDPLNMALICNACNVEMVGEVAIRRAKVLEVGRASFMDEWVSAGYEEDRATDNIMMRMGCVLVQEWLDDMQMKTRFNAWSMAELGVLGIAQVKGVGDK